MNEIVIRKPDDWHVHLRDGAAMADAVQHTARQFRRAIIMPNLKPPVVVAEQALAYHRRILDALPGDTLFQPLMTLYLTDHTTPQDIIDAKASGVVFACKLYPAGATTNSDSGVTHLAGLDDTLAAMSELGVPLLLHGEVTDDGIDIFEREAVYVDTVLPEIMARHSKLKVVLEHITTRKAAEWVADGPDNLAATITPHHLLVNRNHMLAGGIRPHLYCLPILKTEDDRQALIAAATSGSPKFFLGTDSAPHPVGKKESACGCAGVFSAHGAVELYAEAFDAVDALNKLEGFASIFGPRFYGLPVNEDTISLIRQPMAVPPAYAFGETTVHPFRAGEHLMWTAQF